MLRPMQSGFRIPLSITIVVAIGCAEPDRDLGNRGLDALTVGDAPLVSIGVSSGRPEEELFGVSDATILPDGRIVVANCGTGELRWFDPSGDYVRAVGGFGDGPSEFGFLRRVFRMDGDRIGVFDGTRMRLLVFDVDAEILSQHPGPSIAGGYVNVLGWVSGGGFVATRLTSEAVEGREGTHRAAVDLFTWDPARGVLDSVHALPGRDLPELEPAGGPAGTVRLSRDFVVAVFPGGVYHGSQDAAGIVLRDAALRVRDTLAVAAASEPVTSDARAEFEAMMEDDAHVPAGGVGPIFSDAYAPAMPTYGDLIAGDDGRLWVQDPIRPGRYPLVWTAYEDGRATARVELPPRFFPFEFGPRRVLGVSSDPTGVERVQLWALVPGTLPGVELPPRDAEPPNVSRCGPWGSR